MFLRQIVFSSFFFTLAANLPSTAQAVSSLEEVVTAYESFTREVRPGLRAAEDGVAASSWADVSLSAQQAELSRLEGFAAGLAAMDVSIMDEQASLNHAILSTLISDQITALRFDEARLPFTGDWGYSAEILFTLSSTTLRNEADAQATIDRIRAIPALLMQHETNMRRGLETGFVSYIDPLETVIEQLEASLAAPIEETELYAPFVTLPGNIPEEAAQDIRDQALLAVNEAIVAFQFNLAFLKDEYLPNTRAETGIGSVPGGRDYYAAMTALHTTRPDLTPDDVHQIGLSEVARIRAEMDAIIEEVGFEGSFSDFLAFLRTDPQFYPQTPEELMARAARIAKDIDLRMPAYFGQLPRQPYGVEPVPESIAPGYTTGRYVPGDLDEGEAGTYWVNTYALDQRGLFELPALTAHEAVPGHHQQIAVAAELENVPEYRRYYYATSFGEGWGLYAETLAGEMGIYQTPYERFGKLSYEMWRACRLVSDTGMHWMGWTREQGEACFIENTALSPLNIETEVTRYIGWPGQALGYKIGELTILALREEAREALGDDFDIRAFHDVVLEQGALPLEVLEARVRTWIEGQAG